MDFRQFINSLEITKFSKPISKKLEAASILNELKDKPALFENIIESNFRIVGNIFTNKEIIARYFGVSVKDLIHKIISAIENPSKPIQVNNALCQEIEIDDIDLDKLPIMFHCENDGGNYITSGVYVTKDRDGICNLDFHRAMQIGKNKFAIRVVKGRDFDTLLKKNLQLPVAVCIGNTPNVLLAAATSVNTGQNELEIANSLEPLEVVKAKTFDGLIPANCEFVLEGIVRFNERFKEGPFVDLTETYDIIREEPVFEVTKITHRKDAIWQALLPGQLEHKILMGMPREPTIYKEIVKSGVNCIDVNITPGGCCWLHTVVKIDKKDDSDGKKAILAGFKGHKSCKHIFIVDKDINIYDPLEVEWAMATRFQADSELIIKEKEQGSSLDPSADPINHNTTKCGFDLTKTLETKGKIFEKVSYKKIDIKKFL